MVFSLYSSLFCELREKKLKWNSFLTRKPRSHVRILIYRTWPNTESCLCTSLFSLWSSIIFNSSPCSYHGLFYGHAMFIGNSQKEARYLSFPLFIAVRFNSRYFDSICWRIFYRRNRRHRVAMLFKFVSTRRDSDEPDKINISILSGCCLWTLCDHKTNRETFSVKHFLFGDKIETSFNLFSLFISRGLSFPDLRLGVMKTQTPGNK